MPDSYPFPMYSGLLEPKHYKQIGSAIWLFLWCVSSTTAEQEKEGIVWGVVLGNKPMQLPEIAEKFAVSEKTVSRWLGTLEEHGYVKVTRAPRGLILSVRNSKKFTNQATQATDKNVRSPSSEQTKMSDQIESDQTNVSDHSDKNVRSNKDITEDITTTDIAKDTFDEIFDAFCRIHGKLDIHVKPTDVVTMQEIVSMGIPPELVIRVMEQIYQDRGSRIHSFSYYKDAILEAWQSQMLMSETAVTTSPTTPVPSGTVAPGQVALSSRQRIKKSRLELRNEEALRKIKEAEEKEAQQDREGNRTPKDIFHHSKFISGI